jgi:hypothetical protein
VPTPKQQSVQPRRLPKIYRTHVEANLWYRARNNREKYRCHFDPYFRRPGGAGPWPATSATRTIQTHFHVLGFVPSKIRHRLAQPPEPPKIHRCALHPIFKLDACSRIFLRPVAIYCPASLGNGGGRTREKVAAMIRYLSASLALGAVAKGS